MKGQRLTARALAGGGGEKVEKVCLGVECCACVAGK